MTNAFRWTVNAAAAALLIAVLGAIVLAWLWRDRPALADLPWPVAQTLPDGFEEQEKAVAVTWLGISTLLFDDGETQVMIDGTITRLSVFDVALQRKVRSDIATINYVMDEFRIDRLAALVPVHSHFDHAMDAGNVANRSSAVILGSESTANIARGAGVPVDQYQTLASGETRVFGDFTITLLASRHVPNGPGDAAWFTGVIDEPLEQPARTWSWKSGAVHSVLIEHPNGTALIQGSAGYIENQLDEHAADVAFLSVAGLASQDEEYAQGYWQHTAGAVGARRVFPLHIDDFTLPFGEIALFPKVVDDVPGAAAWIDAAAEDVPVERLPFGIPVTLY